MSTKGGATFSVSGPSGMNPADFSAAWDALPAPIYTTDCDGTVTYFNAAAERLVGRSPQIGSDRWCIVWKVFLPDGSPLPVERRPLAIALNGGEPSTSSEYLAERPDGTRFWFSSSPAVLRDEKGLVTGAINLLTDITKQKNAELEAKEGFRALVNATRASVKILSAEGTLQFVSPATAGMIDVPSTEGVIGDNMYDSVAPQDRERFRAFSESIRGGGNSSLQFDAVEPEGKQRRVETHAAPLYHLDGTIAHIGVTRDVTEFMRTQGAALLLSAIVDSSDDAIISKDLTGVITSWNKSAERLFGYTAEEAIGRTVASLLIPDDRQDEELDILARLKQGMRMDHFETVRRRKDGSLLDISLTISPVKDARGHIVGASKIARDITESKRIQAALIESESRFRQLADSMPQIVWTARPDGIVDYFNERWFEFTGFSRDSNSFGTWERILHPEDLARTGETWAASVRTGEQYSIEYRFFDSKENRWRWFFGRALPIRDNAGEIVKWFGTCTDVDGLKRTQAELQRANEDLEQFAFSASHDLQEPLRSVKIYSELLTNRYASQLDGEGLKFLRFVRLGATRMEALIRDLLSFTQVMKIGPVETIVDANEQLKMALANLTEAIEVSGAQITAAPLPSLPVNGTHLQQLFQNLIGNAVKYRSPERTVTVDVAAERQSDSWVFRIADNGIGIDPQYKENIFGLFKRLHSHEQYSGTGIGLAICQRIVERYHGRIWVESEPGKGSTFFFTLPV